jgi:glycosyltransferase involved in cell wall biosynthesis
MKIVFLAPFGIRPKGTLIARMLPIAAELTRMGHRVTIVAPPYTNPEDSGKVEVIEGVTLRNVVLGPRRKVLAAPVLGWRMFRLLLAERADLVHLFKPKGYAGLAGMLQLCCRACGVRLPPLVLDTDDWEGEGGMNALHGYSSLEKKFYAFQESWITRRASGVTVASRALEGMVRQLGVGAKRILYLPNCVGKARPGAAMALRERLGIVESAPVLLLYTRFFEFSQEKLHRVLAEVYRQVPGVRFLVVGKGRAGEESLLLEAARAGGFVQALVPAGWVEPQELPDYLAAGDLAIYPFADTLLNRCKCPAKLTELLLAGVPVVADRVGQVAEYLDPSLGLLCDPDDWQDMARRAAELLLDPPRRRELGERGRRYIQEHYQWQQYCAQLNDFYRECLNR